MLDIVGHYWTNERDDPRAKGQQTSSSIRLKISKVTGWWMAKSFKSYKTKIYTNQHLKIYSNPKKTKQLHHFCSRNLLFYLFGHCYGYYLKPIHEINKKNARVASSPGLLDQNWQFPSRPGTFGRLLQQAIGSAWFFYVFLGFKFGKDMKRHTGYTSC